MENQLLGQLKLVSYLQKSEKMVIAVASNATNVVLVVASLLKTLSLVGM